MYIDNGSEFGEKNPLVSSYQTLTKWRKQRCLFLFLDYGIISSVTRPLTAICTNEDGNIIYSADVDGVLRLFDTTKKYAMLETEEGLGNKCPPSRHTCTHKLWLVVFSILY
jgi:hypothetical protein